MFVSALEMQCCNRTKPHRHKRKPVNGETNNHTHTHKKHQHARVSVCTAAPAAAAAHASVLTVYTPSHMRACCKSHLPVAGYLIANLVSLAFRAAFRAAAKSEPTLAAGVILDQGDWPRLRANLCTESKSQATFVPIPREAHVRAAMRRVAHII